MHRKKKKVHIFFRDAREGEMYEIIKSIYFSFIMISELKIFSVIKIENWNDRRDRTSKIYRKKNVGVGVDTICKPRERGRQRNVK